MLNDFRQAARLMARQRAFTAIAVLTLALGIGTNTAMLALVNALLFRPLPAHEPHRLRFLYLTDPGVPDFVSAIRFENYLDLQQRRDLFVDVLARGVDQAQITARGDIRHARGERVSGNYFEVLGVGPSLGRVLTPADDHAGSEPVVVISAGLWQSRFSGDPAVLGHTLQLDERAYTIVGVMPDQFRGTLGTWEHAQYWAPMQQRASDRRCQTEQPFSQSPVAAIGRLRPGVSAAQAQAALSGIRLPWTTISEGATPRDRLWTLTLLEAGRSSLPFDTFGRVVPEKFAIALMALATIVLLIAAANLGGMLAARGVTRQGEMATRLALGAGRWRLTRQLLTESLTLALLGGALGLLVARWALHAFIAAVPAQFAPFNLSARTPMRIMTIDARIDWAVVLYTLVVCLAAGVLVGMVPAWQAGRSTAPGSLTSAAMATPRRASRQLRHWIVIPQICLSLGLLLVAGILVSSLTRLELMDHGYNPAPLVSVSFELPRSGACDGRPLTAEQVNARRRFEQDSYSRMLSAAEAIPGVESVGLTHAVPLEMPRAGGRWVSARTEEGGRAQSTYISRVDVTAGYFELLQIPLLDGRSFEKLDMTTERRVTIISEGLARALWRGRNPVGRHLTFEEAASSYPPRWFEVVGVVGNLDSPLASGGYARPAAYVPLRSGSYARSVVARGSLPPPEMIRELKQVIAKVAPGARVGDGSRVADAIAAYLYPRRVAAGILSAAGVVGLFLASIGLYGVVSYSVAQRTRELGVRRALGADARDIIALILREGARVSLMGAVLGVIAGYAAVRFTSSRLVSLPSIDTTTLIAAPALLAAVVLIACYIPARRASRIDPMAALRDL